MRKKLLAAFVAVMTVCLGLVPTVSADTTSTATSTDTASSTAVTLATESTTTESTIDLSEDTTGSITVESGQTVTLNLNGYTLSNDDDTDTITVEYGGTLIIAGPGTIENTSNSYANIYNNGTVTFNGENGTIYLTRPDDTGSNTNSYYTILNHGTMTIDNVNINVPDDNFSSMIENGYYNYSSGNARTGYVEGTNSANPTMTINSCTVVGGSACVKNDDGGILTINDGDFSGGLIALQNANQAVINGGTFTNKEDPESSPSCLIWNAGVSGSDVDLGELTINGGVFTKNSEDDAIFYRSSSSPDSVTITGGTFIGDLFPDGDVTSDDNNSIVISGGTFTQDVSDALAGNFKITTETINGVTYYEIADDTTTTVVPETYDINIGDTSNGTVTASSTSAEKGDTITLTVTPADGYELDTITASDASSNSLDLTENSDGTYSFTMPASDVEVSATFKATEDTSTTTDKKFTDVPEGAYYYDPVYWAVENGITAGTSDTTFTPDGICTRAEVVTFLYRQAGSPSVTGTTNFTDVASDAYYYDAVVWAEQNGIAAGTSATTFSPDQTINRAQAVTFMYRAANATASGTDNQFTDVEKGSYYYDAVTWSAENNITAGTTATTFSPEKSCTRAEIVTFLYRESQNTAS
jgi:hypothetical protein